MKYLNGKAALQSIDISDLVFTVSDEQKKQLQHVLTNMYSDVLELCTEHGWTPYLIGGSALGAIRHGGFIPWDDDLDVGMLRSEYDMFLEEFEKKYSKEYLISKPGGKIESRVRFAKILKKGTLFKDLMSSSDDAMNGIFIDVFPIDNVPDNRFLRKLKGFRSDILAYISSQVYTYCNCNSVLKEALKRTGTLNYAVRMIVGRVGSLKEPNWWFEQYDKSVQYTKAGSENSVYCTIAAGRKHYFGEIIERSKITPPRIVKFEDINAPVFIDVESYLSHMYGDYMKIPPADSRESHSLLALKF